MAQYGRYPFNSFSRGLNLLAKPDAVDPAECIDAMNVIFSERGATEDRPGYAAGGSALTNRVASLEGYYTTSGTKQILAGCGTRLEALNTSFAVVNSASGLTNAVWDFARFGTPNIELAYAGNGTDTLRKWNGSEWSAPTAAVDGVGGKAMPKAGSIWVDPTSNRLFCTGFSTTTGGPNGTTSSPAHLYASEPGDPEAYESTAFEQFTPGDGEKIMAGLAWKEFNFVFKETKFFVLSQTGENSAGKPIFNYRPVEGGAGLVSKRAVCSHPSGVYFMARNGVYRTTGQEPELISSLIEPIWSGDTSPFYTGGVLSHGSITNCAMGVWEERVYLAFPTSEANNGVLLYDPRFEWWSILNIPAACFTSFRTESQEELLFGYASGENLIGRHSDSHETDAGTAIASHHRSGWFDLEIPDEKTVRASKVWGTGTVNMALDSDFTINAGNTVELDMTGSTGAVWEGEGFWEEPTGYWQDSAQDLVEAYRGESESGTVFSFYLASEGSFSVHRLEHLVRQTRNPSTAQ